MQPISSSVSNSQVRPARKRSLRVFSPWSLALLSLAVVPFVSGCDMVDQSLGVPTPLPDPTKVPTPEPVIFNASDDSPRGTALNGTPGLPDSFAVTDPNGAMVNIHTVVKGVVSAASDPVHLAGIVAPQTGQPGADKVAAAILNWTSGNLNDADIDTHYPTDVNGVRLVVIYFHRKDKSGTDTLYCLNRMLVRAGLAVVDLYSPTSFDTKPWLNEEAYARVHHLGLWAFPDIFLHLQQRPSNLSGSAIVGAAGGTAGGGTAASGATGSGITNAAPGTTPAPGVMGAAPAAGGTPAMTPPAGKPA